MWRGGGGERNGTRSKEATGVWGRVFVHIGLQFALLPSLHSHEPTDPFLQSFHAHILSPLTVNLSHTHTDSRYLYFKRSDSNSFVFLFTDIHLWFGLLEGHLPSLISVRIWLDLNS